MNSTDPKEEKLAADTVEWMIGQSKAIIEPYKEGWADRRDIARTLISLSSAALIFTITFSSTILGPSTHRFWRYSILVCWTAFIGSLIAALGSLWESMGLSHLPVLVEENREAIKEATRTAYRDTKARGVKLTADAAEAARVTAIFQEQWEKLCRADDHVRYLLRTSLILFGIALSTLTAIGIRQLLR